MKCHKVLCGRYGNKHAFQHYISTDTKHCVAMGVGDLSFWCYKCDDYLHHLSIKPIFDVYKIVHQIKFGEPIPKKLEDETDFGGYYDYSDDDQDDEEQEDEKDDNDNNEIKGRDPKSNPLTNSGANRGLGNVDSGKDTVLEEDQIEYFDSDQVLRQKAKKVAEMILISKNKTVIHTGAGISTSANLPDYRGPNGVWTLKAKGKNINKNDTVKDLDNVSPTYTHMALVQLMKNDLLNYVVTTNVDGLHIKSGIDRNKLAELHGSIYTEYCNNCGKYFHRDFNVQKLQSTIAKISTVFTRFTGRMCDEDKCKKNNKGKLRDSIIAFGEQLPGNELIDSMRYSQNADLNIVIGSSMRVQPACNLPVSHRSNDKSKQFLVLINLQKTPYDNVASMRVWAKCDDFMKLVMDELKLKVEPFKPKQSDQ